MPYNPVIHHRRSIRLKGYDYSQAGMYFVTICVQKRAYAIRPSHTVGAIVRGYKSAVTKQLNQLGYTHSVWQRGYHEHIIRNEKSYQYIANYIINNPQKWEGGWVL